MSLKATANLSGFGVTFFRLLSCFSSFHSFLPSSFASSPRSVHLLFVLTTIFFFTTSSLSLSFSPVLSLNLKLLCLRGQGSDFSVKITLFQLLTRTHSHPLFCTRFASFYERDKNALAPTLPTHLQKKKLVFGLLGWALLLLRRRTHSFRQQNQYTLTTPSMTMMTVGASLLTFWDAGAREREGLSGRPRVLITFTKNLR